ncbi:MAG: EamA family transporter [Nostochopsis sp.]
MAIAVQRFDPLNLVALRFFIASLVLLVFALLSKQIRRPDTKDIPLLLAQGIFGISAFMDIKSFYFVESLFLNLLLIVIG